MAARPGQVMRVRRQGSTEPFDRTITVIEAGLLPMVTQAFSSPRALSAAPTSSRSGLRTASTIERAFTHGSFGR